MSGYNFSIPMFADVSGKGTFDLQDIKLVGSEGNGDESIVCYDKDAILTGDEYYWYTPDGMGFEDGWYLGDGTPVETNFPFGTGMYLYCTDQSIKVQYAGEVKQDEYVGEFLLSGYNMVGNSTPVAIHIQDLKLIGSEGNGDESIVGYDKDAILTGVEFYWYTPDGMGFEDGWYLGDGTLITDKILQPGEGVYLYCTDQSIKFQIPNPMTYVMPEFE